MLSGNVVSAGKKKEDDGTVDCDKCRRYSELIRDRDCASMIGTREFNIADT